MIGGPRAIWVNVSAFGARPGTEVDKVDIGPLIRRRFEICTNLTKEHSWAADKVPEIANTFWMGNEILNENLQLQSTAQTGPQLDHPLCRPRFTNISCKNHQYEWTNNYNKILLIDYVNKCLISCGTLYQGVCEKRSLENVTQVLSNNSYPNCVVNVNKSSYTVAFIGPGPAINSSSNVLYVANTFYDHLFARIPSVGSRKLSDFTLLYDDVVEEFTQSYIRFDHSRLSKFLVHYVYGFSSEGYSYILARQPRSPDDKDYRSVVVSVCQNDKKYWSYIEVPLSCRHGDQEYNLLQAAFMDSAGRNLALSLGVSLQSDVLYSVFSVGEPDSDRPTSKSALCIFPVSSIRRVIADNRRKCFNGEGKYGGGHLANPQQCGKNTEHVIDENYCGEVSANKPQIGTIPIVAEAVVTFPEESTAVVTAVGVDITHEYTVAFVGTANGHLKKISLDSNTTANVYESFPVAPGEAFKSDVSFDEEGEHLYLLTTKKVSFLVCTF
ncbi:nicotinamidase-like [Plakobranchus ocellatus]|uniref:Nicotinamidase-like n=1 Tax=Plakobranchus ocellatus TaxID=259542 RepID=A0AAV4AJI3_9GAST|nr:nicotinamidase-like [Plakobranchus ocellatus]